MSSKDEKKQDKRRQKSREELRAKRWRRLEQDLCSKIHINKKVDEWVKITEDERKEIIAEYNSYWKDDNKIERAEKYLYGQKVADFLTDAERMEILEILRQVLIQRECR